MDVYGTIKGAMNSPATLVGSLASGGHLVCTVGAVHGEITGQLTLPRKTPAYLLNEDGDNLVTDSGDNLIGIISAESLYIQGELSASATLQGELTVPSSSSAVYKGAYEFTPTRETQVISIDHKEALQDITINPIPQNYGLITYNGSVLTVS